MNRFWRFIVNKGDDGQESVELRISGEIVSDDDSWIYEWLEIDHTSPNAFREELAQYKGKNLTVWIDSWGGDVFAAAGIYNALKEHKGRVTVKIDGKAVSAASVIAMAGDEVLMSPVSIMMIHNPWTLAIGEAKDMRHIADVLDEVKETIINAYQLKTNLSRNKISRLMDEETWMSAKKAVSEGFADGILYQDDANQQTDPIQNFSLNRLAIVNSANKSILRAAEVMKKADIEDKPDIKDQSNVEEEKEKLLLELDLI